MSIDARYQAIPYEPLLARSMVDREVAEAVQFFPDLAFWPDLAPVARQVAGERPGIVDRTFTTRAWDAVYWLLAPNRRADKDRDPDGPAEIAVFGAEPFPCGATATQGMPLRFVRPATAAAVAGYVESMADGAVYDSEAMTAAGVYKSPWDRDELLDLLARYARLYRLAAELNECVLVVHD